MFSLRRRASSVAVAAALALSACRSKPPAPATAESGSEQTLVDTARLLLDKIRDQEAKKDATCWTTVRLMESFQVARPLDETGVLAKIESSKILLVRLWQRASSRTSAPVVRGADVEAVIPPAARPLLASLGDAAKPGAAAALDIGVQTAVKDYHRVTENLRVLLSIVFEAEAGEGLFASKTVDIKPIDADAASRLAEVSTAMTVMLLRDARVASEARKQAQIGAEDVRAAYAKVAAALSLDDASAEQAAKSAPHPYAVKIEPGPEVQEVLRSLTQTYVLNKIRSLRAWNSAVWQAERDGNDKQAQIAAFRDLLGKLISVPMTDDGVERFLLEVAVFTDVVLSGWEPLRTDTFESSLDALARQRRGGGVDRRSRYLTLVDVSNALATLFPHHTDANGDVRYVMEKNRREREFQLLGPSCDAMRDVTVHWFLLARLIHKDGSLPLDPFAAELVSERTSEMALHLLLEVERVAKERKLAVIDRTTWDDVTWKYPAAYFIPDPRDRPAAWTDADEKHKADVLAGYPAPLFADVTRASGISPKSCTKPAKIVDESKLPFKGLQRYMGSGVAVGDFDADGLPDLFLGADACNRLYKNLGDYKFRDVTEAAGVTGLDLDSRHPVFADFDGDGKLDLLVIQSDHPSRLFRQSEPGRFNDVTAASGLRTTEGAHTAFFFDYDEDGDLDLHVGYYGAANPEHKYGPSIDGRNGRPNQLWRNDGHGRFEEVAANVGVASTGWTLAGAAFDANADGHVDFFLANDFGDDELFLNDGHGRFREVGRAWGSNDRGSGMNVSVTDADADGRWDVYVSMIDMFSKSIGFVLPVASSIYKLDDRIVKSTFYLSGNKLFVNQAGRSFRAGEADWFEPGDRGWGWSANFFDYDNDGDEDLYLANGWAEWTANWYQSNQLYLRDGKRYFLYPGASRRWEDPQDGRDRTIHYGLRDAKVVSAESYLGSSRAVAAVDLTGTGRSDLIVVDYHDPPHVLRNLRDGANHWLKVKLDGAGANRFGVGATVRLWARGLPPQMRNVSAGSNYLSQDELVVRFGLGADEAAERLEVVWPGGKRQQVSGPLRAGTVVTVAQR